MCHYSEDGSYQKGCSCIDCMEEDDHRAEQRRLHEECGPGAGFVHVSAAAAPLVDRFPIEQILIEQALAFCEMEI
jgi:hypothetical protein